MTAATPGSPQAIANKEKAVQALALRKTGATYEQIAQALGYASRGAVEAGRCDSVRGNYG